jgi:hypothetical protein
MKAIRNLNMNPNNTKSMLQLVFKAYPVSTTNKQIIYGNIKKIQQ